MAQKVAQSEEVWGFDASVPVRNIVEIKMSIGKLSSRLNRGLLPIR